MKVSELREKSETELRDELVALAREAFNLRMQAGTGQLARFTEIKKVRRNVARIKTVLGERSREKQA